MDVIIPKLTYLKHNVLKVLMEKELVEGKGAKLDEGERD
jgi:hypothetical protein